MQDEDTPTPQELPTTGALLRSTVVAAVVAAVLLVTVVLPAEYGIDLTGIGGVTGLPRMGEIKRLLSQDAGAAGAIESCEQDCVCNAEGIATALPASRPADGRRLEHETTVTLAPDKATEVKLVMSKGATVEYSWSSDGGAAFFDLHGDSRSANVDYHRYSKGTEQSLEGQLIAAFDGNHGWFWRNRSPETISITLRTKGAYSEIREMK